MRAKLLLSAAATAGLAAAAAGQQFPALVPPTSTAAPPLATAPPPPLPTGIAPYPAQPEGPTIWSKLGVSKAQREYCRRQLCRTPVGRLMGRIQNPISNITGGLIPPFCPLTPSLAELMDPGVIGAAAKVKQDRAGAAQRIEAIRELAGVDCTYWPEAEEALIGALRTDRNECVRYEAALALARGCCCTCKVIVALSHTVCCSDKDGGFMEKSARVRSAAAIALERCLTMTCCPPELPPAAPGTAVPVPPINGGGGPEAPLPPEGATPPNGDVTNSVKFVAPAAAKPGPKAEKPAAPLTFKEYYAAVPRVPRSQVLANARRALEIGRRIGTSVNEDVIPADYAAAGFSTPADGGTAMVRKPATLWDMMTRTTAEQPQVEIPTPGGAAPPAPLGAVVKSSEVPHPTEPAPVPVPKAAAPGVVRLAPATAPKAPAAAPKVYTTPAPRPIAAQPVTAPVRPATPVAAPAAKAPVVIPAAPVTVRSPAAAPPVLGVPADPLPLNTAPTVPGTGYSAYPLPR